MSEVDVAARVEQLFSESGAFREGHFKLKSGRHGDRYLEKFQVLQWPDRVAELGSMLADRARSTVGGAGRIDVVVGPTTGGVVLAHEVARNLATRGIFAELVTTADGSTRELRRGFRIAPGERVLLVDDVVTTGASLVEMVPLIEASGGELVFAVVIVDRSGELHEIESPATGRRYRADALWSLRLPTFEPGPATCPGCAAGLPLEAPGSSGLTR